MEVQEMASTVTELVEQAQTISSEARVSKAISAIESSPQHSLVVLNEDKSVAGMLDGRCLLDFHENADITKCKSVAQKTPVVSEETTPEELVAHFLDTHAHAIPFVKKGVLNGVVSRTSCLKLILDSSAARESKVADYMSHSGAVAPESTSIQGARKKMRELGVYHLAVTDDKDRLCGVVSSFDIAVKVVPHQKGDYRQATFSNAQEQGVEMEPVSSIMKTVLQTATPQTPLKKAIEQMISANVACLLVIEGDAPVGLLSVRDALHTVLKPTPEPVMVYGLREDEKAMAESIRGLGAEFLGKLDKKTRVDYLALHVKSFKEGVKRRYAVKGKLSLKGRLLTAATPETSAHKNVWDLHASVKEVLDELGRIARGKLAMPLDRKKHALREE